MEKVLHQASCWHIPNLVLSCKQWYKCLRSVSQGSSVVLLPLWIKSFLYKFGIDWSRSSYCDNHCDACDLPNLQICSVVKKFLPKSECCWKDIVKPLFLQLVDQQADHSQGSCKCAAQYWTLERWGSLHWSIHHLCFGRKCQSYGEIFHFAHPFFSSWICIGIESQNSCCVACPVRYARFQWPPQKNNQQSIGSGRLFEVSKSTTLVRWLIPLLYSQKGSHGEPKECCKWFKSTSFAKHVSMSEARQSSAQP